MDTEELEFKLSSWRQIESCLLAIILNQTKIENTYRNINKLDCIINVSVTYFVKLSDPKCLTWQIPGTYTDSN